MATKRQADTTAPTAPATTGPPLAVVVLWLGVGVLVVGLVLGLVALSDDDAGTLDWLSSVMLLLLAGTSTGSAVWSRRAVKQTNGTLDARIREQVTQALNASTFTPPARHDGFLP